MTAESASGAPPARGEGSLRAADVLFDARLTPHRSLGRLGFGILMAAVAVAFLAIGLGFFLIGAWPVVGFLGAEFLLLYVAFQVNYRRARIFETLELTREAFTVRRIDTRGVERRWEFQPYWLRVEMDQVDEEPDLRAWRNAQLRLSSHGRALIVGSFLSLEERAALAAELRRHLDRLRAEMPQASLTRSSG